MPGMAVRERNAVFTGDNPAWPTFPLTLGCLQGQACRVVRYRGILISRTVLPEGCVVCKTPGLPLRYFGITVESSRRDSGPSGQRCPNRGPHSAG